VCVRERSSPACNTRVPAGLKTRVHSHEDTHTHTHNILIIIHLQAQHSRLSVALGIRSGQLPFSRHFLLQVKHRLWSRAEAGATSPDKVLLGKESRKTTQNSKVRARGYSLHKITTWSPFENIIFYLEL
jgi:hypothetical protein